MKLKLSRRRAYFLDDELASDRLRVIKATHPKMDTDLIQAISRPHLCVTNVSRTGETLTGYVIRHSSVKPHFESFKVLTNITCYGRICHVGEECEGVIIGEL